MSATSDEGPPSYNMGVTLGESRESEWSKDRLEEAAPNLGIAFDWYQATFANDPRVTLPVHTRSLVERLADELKPAKVKEIERGLHGYKRRTVFLDEKGGTSLLVLHGGQKPNVTATSHRADAFGDLARRIDPHHAVTRVDVALDFEEAGGWKRALKLCKKTMTDAEMESGVLFLPDKATAGATYYMGSKASPVMARLYQKGYEQLKRYPDSGADPDWVRLELQVRPQKEAKQKFASVSRDDVWGATAWSRDLIKRFRGWSPAGVRVAPRSESDWERTQRFLVQQYAGHMGLGGELSWLPVGKAMRAGGASERDVADAELRERRQAFDAYMKVLGDEVWTALEERSTRSR